MTTPTQDLILDVLGARYRLGENLWTFDTRVRSALVDLETQGLVTTMHGTVEHSMRASLTDAGRERVLSPTYVPPAAVISADVARMVAEMSDWLEGRRSWMNLGPLAPYTPDVIAVMDAQEVTKRAAAIPAYLALRASIASTV
jgi:hypothetical protein